MQDTMVGKKFGNLVVQKLAYRGKDSKKYWECQCGCGRVCLVQESHLKNGHTKSCGCLRKKRMTNRWLDLTGQRYGRLVVLRLANQDEISVYGTGKEGEPGKIAEENAGVLGRLQDLWLCRCDCGNVCVCQKENLRDGKTKSCGCFRNETRQKNMRKAIHFVDGICVERIACRKTCVNNTSGHRGVYRRSNGTWRASIGFQGKVYNLGTFTAFNEAVQARVKAEKELYDPFIRSFQAQKKKTSGNEIPSCAVGAEKQMEEVLAE